MKLDRHTNPSGIGKYALIELRKVPSGYPKLSGGGNEFLTIPCSCVDFGDLPQNEFFVIRLKDKYAHAALSAYARNAEVEDPEYAKEIFDLASKALSHPNKRNPD